MLQQFWKYVDFSFFLIALCVLCVCVCVLQCLNYLTLPSCLFLSLPYTHICIAVCVTLLFAFQFDLQPCFCFEKSDLGRNSNHLQSENFICLIGRCGCSSQSSRTFCRSASRTVQRLMQQSKNLEIRVRFYLQFHHSYVVVYNEGNNCYSIQKGGVTPLSKGVWL